MAKISLNLDERSMKNGMAHIRIRINHKKSCAYVSTGVYVEPQYFIPGSLYDPIHRKGYLAIEKREQVAKMVRKLDEWLAEADRQELARLSAKDIKERVWSADGCAGTDVRTRGDMLANGKQMGNAGIVGMDVYGGRKANDEQDFVVWFGKYGDSRRTDKTRKSYEYAWNVVREYCAVCGLQTLYFSDIDYARLADLSRWLRATGRGESTRYMIESYVRAAYKEAQKMHLVDRAVDPYFDYSVVRAPQKDIEVLTLEQMRMLATVDLGGLTGLERARDVAMMSFYLCGANLLDIYLLSEVSNGEAVFVRHKVEMHNQRATRIRIEPELQVLMERYKGKKTVLRFSETSPNYTTFQTRISSQLSGVSTRLGFKVTMAMVRRTWASIAGSLDISDRVIDKSMGHVDKSVKDRHYEQYDWSRTARANRAVIDAIQ